QNLSQHRGAAIFFVAKCVPGGIILCTCPLTQGAGLPWRDMKSEVPVARLPRLQNVFYTSMSRHCACAPVEAPPRPCRMRVPQSPVSMGRAEDGQERTGRAGAARFGAAVRQHGKNASRARSRRAADRTGEGLRCRPRFAGYLERALPDLAQLERLSGPR